MGHLAPFQDTEDDKQALVTGAANRAAIFNPTSAASLTTSFNSNSNPAYVQDLYRWLIRDNRELREEIFKFLKDPLYQPDYSLSLANFRELTSQRVVKFVQQRFFSVSDYINDPLRFQACLESLSFCDYSLAIKSGVHFTLCGGTIAKLGTERHHREYLPKMDTLELPGCFAMTELANGSDVFGIQTMATYDPATQEFIINTPNNSARKAWIGGGKNRRIERNSCREIPPLPSVAWHRIIFFIFQRLLIVVFYYIALESLFYFIFHSFIHFLICSCSNCQNHNLFCSAHRQRPMARHPRLCSSFT